MEKLERENKRLKESLISQEEAIRHFEDESNAKSSEIKSILDEFQHLQEKRDQKEEELFAELAELRTKLDLLLETNEFLNDILEIGGKEKRSDIKERDTNLDSENLKLKLNDALKARDEAMSILTKFEKENKSLRELKTELEAEVANLKMDQERKDQTPNTYRDKEPKVEEPGIKNNMANLKQKALEDELYQAHMTISDLELKLHKLLSEKQRDKANNIKKLVDVEDKVNFLIAENSNFRELLEEINRTLNARSADHNLKEIVAQLMDLIEEKRSSLGLHGE